MLRRSLLFALFIVAAPAGAQTNTVAERPAAGAYTEDQAARGDTVFKMYCASCHSASYHKDEQFRMNWFGRSVADLFRILKTTMPEDNIGGLTDDEYTSIIAYVLRLNGFAPGKDSLRADTLEMRRIRIGPTSVDSVRPHRR